MRQHEIASLGSYVSLIRRGLRRVGRVPLLCLLAWLYTVYAGEQKGFARQVERCTWNNWETWKPDQRPHRILLVADPQIVDPHTYPDRPWPLSSLTVLYTDLYLKRAYRELLRQLQPDSTIFLGDLFDGGREWGTQQYKSPDEQYRCYGQDFWLKEYQRFERLFVDTWHQEGIPHLPGSNGRRLIASVPGNHDLGFGGGINPHVKNRFDAHFGPLNRIDVLGNHTMVSLDTVSLSAMDQVDPVTGAAGQGDGSGSSSSTTNIWKPVKDYLQDIRNHRDRALQREMNVFDSFRVSVQHRESTFSRSQKQTHSVEAVDGPVVPHVAQPAQYRVASSQFPTIILSHVPFYRSDTANCGPHREKGSSIPISAGYQYQNVLTPLISKDIVDSLDPSQVAMIYSGDDHDYCEIDHDRFTGRIKEITVKSISWAMGVRQPGVQLVSLWNPIELSDHEAETSSNKAIPRNTVQNHLCLLPDQLAIFIRYGELLAFTLVVLLLRAIIWKAPTPMRTGTSIYDEHVLPTTEPSYEDHALVSSKVAGSLPSRRNTNGSRIQKRSASPSKFKFEADSDDWGMPTTDKDKAISISMLQHRGWQQYLAAFAFVSWPQTKLQALTHSVAVVAGPVLLVYFWFMWHDL